MEFGAVHDDWIRRYKTRTDLALEAREVVIQHEGPPEIPGVTVESEDIGVGTVTRVVIETEEGARAVGKMPGRYSTVESPALRRRDQQALEKVARLIAREIGMFLDELNVPADGEVLVVGLGNWNATPDAVGPRTVHHLIVTRHFYYMAPPPDRQGARPVAALSPGVLGITGLETAEIVHGLVRQIQPKLVVCVDALAARSTERLCSTVQIADAGIQPGSGVGNKRFGITRQTLGVPVLAVGVPTVVHALTVVADGLDRLAAHGDAEAVQAVPSAPGGGGPAPGVSGAPGGVPLPDPRLILTSQTSTQGARSAAASGAPGTGPQDRLLPQSVKREVIEQVLAPYMGDLIMTPKEIDVLVEDVAETLAEALNQGLHPDLDFNRLILAATGQG
ncbi:MAG: GPR endopeptidase [Firmicutes bacterium]|nr:GPR endopeptidase [Bacillota bacterium]